MANFIASTHQGRVRVERSNKPFVIDMAPAEVDKATDLIGLLMSMVESPVLPEFIKNTPFVIRVFPKQAYALERTDLAGSVPFRRNEADELIHVLKMGLGICLNEQTHGRVVPTSQGVPPIMVGDEPV